MLTDLSDKFSFDQLYRQRHYILLTITVFILVSAFYIGFFQSLFAAICGLFMYFISFVLKFFRPENEEDEKGFNALRYFQVAIAVGISSLCYSSIFLYYNGIEQVGHILNKRSETKVEGFKESSKVVTRYFYIIDNYPHEIELSMQWKTGDTIRYLYTPQLKEGFGDNFSIVPPGANRFHTILLNRGFAFLSVVFYGICTLFTWFISLHCQGKNLLREKMNAATKPSHKLISKTFYCLSYLTFILFVLAIFKNIYNIIPFAFLSIAATTLVLLVILLTNAAEYTFKLSLTIILDLQSYKFLSWVKQVIKVAGYLSFSWLLLKSIITDEKSVFDLIFEFLNKHFDIDIKSVFN